MRGGQQVWSETVMARLSAQIVAQRPRVLLLSMAEAALFAHDRAQLSALRAGLAPFACDIRVVLHMAPAAEAALDAFVLQVHLGRGTGPNSGGAGPVQADLPLFDPAPCVELWQSVFGTDAVLARMVGTGAAWPAAWDDLVGDLGVPGLVPPAEGTAPRRPTVQALARALAVNRALDGLAGGLGAALPLALRHARLMPVLADPQGRQATPDDLAGLAADAAFDTGPLLGDLTAELQAHSLAAASGAPSPAARPRAKNPPQSPPPLSPTGAALLSQKARGVYESFAATRYWPRNEGVVTLDEGAGLPDLPERPARPFDAAPRTGTMIVACMKNEAPYILEWVAHHRAIGVDRFLIFTNDCSDGTDLILDRLAELGVVIHLSNNEWQGKSPQQAALNRAVKLPEFRAADWIIHIDVDEYINIRLGDGQLETLYAAMGDATNLAMTWRLFGNGGVDDIADGAVMARFIGCSPAWVPKPHTMWGFKTLSRNIGAYAKLSCHRPNQLDPAMAGRVRWLNGSLQDVTRELAAKGWRNSTTSIGFDAVQLNHYALRSRESFLIKRQRGRALHVDRSIGLNYWVRHDWAQHPDRTILRHLPRMMVEKAQMLADPRLAELQARALEWHRAKAAELRATPEFLALWDQTRSCDLTDAERMAYAVAEDMES